MSNTPLPSRVRDARATTWFVAGIAALGVATFLALGLYVQRGEIHRLDQALLEAVRSPEDLADAWGPTWFEESMRDLTAFGGVGPLTLVTAAVAGYLLAIRRRRTALLLVLVVAGGAAISFGLKEAFARARPEIVPHGARVLTFSFPSGHSMLSAVTYLTLAALVARVQDRRTARTYVMLLGLALTIAIGFSRVYLGVHWPSDVLAGISIGIAWSAAAWLVERRLQRAGTIEPAPPERTEP